MLNGLVVRNCAKQGTGELPKSVLSTTRYPETVGRWDFDPEPNAHLLISPNPSPNCAPKGLQIVLLAPIHSIDNIGAPPFMTALLTEGL